MNDDTRATLRTAGNCLLAFAAGLLIYFSFPPRTTWFLAPIGVALLVAVLTRFGAGGASVRSGFGYGFLGGAGFFVPLLPWVGMYVGPVPWLGLALACAVYVGVFGIGTVLVWRLPTVLAVPAVAACWTAAEWLRSMVPFGGFPWGRLAFGQSEGPLLPLVSTLGAPGLSFAVALVGAGTIGLVAAVRARALPGLVVGGLALTIPFVAAAVLAPAVARFAESSSTLTVAAVQGNVPRLGLDFNAQRRAVLDNHVQRTHELARAIDRGDVAPPDVVIWPENSSDIDPFRDIYATEIITGAARAVGAPILVGAVRYNGDNTFSNTAVVWEPDVGPADRHDKAIIQPFGEYMPMRGFFGLFFSDLVDMAGSFVPGDSDFVVSAAGVPLGVATCYEVAFDRAFTQAARNGAQYFAVPTNNATFTTVDDTDMTFQQLAMSQVRAVEHGRAVIVAATSGVSAIVSPAGVIEQQSDIFVPDVLVAEVPLHTANTLATVLGPWPERIIGTLALLAAVAGVIARRQDEARNESYGHRAKPQTVALDSTPS
ncbi:apolipoprotein N-acyltransferase [Hoyosella subflava]|uniref:Apolipoprotein N-acyltransferase n=1 Tax=Hoyosella subflava (strain DSM 45089 / JCM 17490 / NBRC 109087 / DQS3-9A1) TaxID=443218 RepID=F6EP42_HOYSD|nr:apolipoprotein N-acyltransferase [Hoyosella subflava]AEF40508.1 Putative apolipoprotein N-acyltransferase [Hoyosella subflava DQS3-9A1]